MSESSDYVSIQEADRESDLFESVFVLRALDIKSEVLYLDNSYKLVLEKKNESFARRQLDEYFYEKTIWPPLLLPKTRVKVSVTHIIAFALVHFAAFALQNLTVNIDVVQAAASTQELAYGRELYRAVTSLFLHADGVHFLGNLYLGLAFAVLLLPLMGSGLTWIGFLVSGSLGNVLNAWFYRNSSRYSIGFSTAVFGAAGIWAGFRFIEQVRAQDGLALWRRAILPLGAGLASLAMWGASLDSDYMAHFWGALVGFFYGALMSYSQLPKKFNASAQAFLNFIVLAIVFLAWYQIVKNF